MKKTTFRNLVFLIGFVTCNALAQNQDTTTTFSYDALGNLKTMNRPLNRSTTYTYDSLSRMIRQEVSVNSGNLVTGQSYDRLGQIVSVTDPRNLITRYVADGLGSQTQLNSPDTQTTNSTMDEAGDVLTTTDARGKTTWFQYDALGRLLQASYQTGVPSTFEYDGGPGGPVSEIGNLTRITDESGYTTFTHDLKGRVLNKTQLVNAGGASVQFAVLYSYGRSGAALDKVESITYPSGKKVNYQYDNSGRVAGITLNQPGSGGEVSLLNNVVYTATGAIQSWTWGNQLLPTYQRTYDLDDRITSYPIDLTGTLRVVSYNAASLIIGYRHTGGPMPSQYDEAFVYDTADRITSFTLGGVTTTYSYDANGNRTQQIGPNLNYTYTYSTLSNRLNSAALSTPRVYNYDSAGNRVSDGIFSYLYNDRGRLSNVRNGAVLDLYYNALDQRVLKAGVTAKTYYVYDEKGHAIGEYAGDNSTEVESVYLGNTPIAVLNSRNYSYVLADHIDTPLVLTQPDGTTVWDWRQRDPFGNNAPVTSAVFGTYDHRFPGQMADSETGLFYNYFRDYDPQVGRYVQSDPVGLLAGPNTFNYADNSPVGNFDFFGLAPGDKFKVSDAAGIAAIRDINPRSIREGVEYAGRIYRNKDGTYSYTSPRKGTKAASDPGQCLPGTKNAGPYHTHGSDSHGAYRDYVFSNPDMDLSDKEGVPSYLGMPDGTIGKYTPIPGRPHAGPAIPIGHGAK